MPVYTYKCVACGLRFDQYQQFTDEPLTTCPECHEVALRKVYQPVGIVFKGKGFYATDNRSPSGMTSSNNNGDGSSKPENAVAESKTTEFSKNEKSTVSASSSPAG